MYGKMGIRSSTVLIGHPCAVAAKSVTNADVAPQNFKHKASFD